MRVIKFILIYFVVLISLIVGLIFPTTFLIVFSFFLLFDKNSVSLFDFHSNKNVNHLLGITIFIWLPVYLAVKLSK